MAWPFTQQVLNKIEVAIMVKTQGITLKTQGTIVPWQLLHIFEKSLMNLTKFILTNNFGHWIVFGKISASLKIIYVVWKLPRYYGIARSKRHNPFTREILNKTQVCNYGQVIAISFFICPFNVKLGLSNWSTFCQYIFLGCKE